MSYLEWFHEAYDILPEAIFLVDERGLFIAANFAAIRLFETTRDALLLNNIAVFLGPFSSIKEYLVNCLRKTQPTSSKFDFTLQNGKILTCRAYGSRLQNNSLLTLLEKTFGGKNCPYIFLRLVKQNDILTSYKLIKETQDKLTMQKYKERELEKNISLEKQAEQYEFEDYYKTWLFTKFIEDLKLPLSILQEQAQALAKPNSPYYAAEVISHNTFESVKLLAMAETCIQNYIGELPKLEEPIELSSLILPILTYLNTFDNFQHLKFQISIPQKTFLVVNEKIIQKSFKTILQGFAEYHTGSPSVAIQVRSSTNGKLVITIYDYDNASILENLPQTPQELLDKQYGSRLDKKLNSHMYLAKKILESYSAKLLYNFHHSKGSIINIIFPKEKVRYAA